MLADRFRTNLKGTVLPSLSLILLIVFLGGNVFAQVTRIDSLHAQEAGIEEIKSIDFTIRNDGLVYVNEELVVRRGDVARRIISGRVDGLVALDSLGRNISLYESAPEEEMQLAGFLLEKTTNQTEEVIWIRYSTRNITKKINGTWTISYSSYFTAKKTIIKIRFPEDTQTTRLEPADLFRTNISSTELWLFPQEEYITFNCSYSQKTDNPNPQTPKENSNNLSIIWTILLAYVIIFTMLILIKRKKKPKSDEEKNNPPSKGGFDLKEK